MTELVVFSTFTFALFGWGLYLRERRRSRDYATDLAQIIHDYPESTDSLRRSLEWDEISQQVRKHE